MLKGLTALLGVICLSMTINLTPLAAQEQNNATTPAVSQPAMNESVETADDTAEIGTDVADENTADDEEFAFGTVVSVAAESITILEYNFDTEEEVQVTYDVNASTAYENVKALNEIAANDEVEINYKEVNGKKTATFISKDVPIEDDEYKDDGLDENQGGQMQPANSAVPTNTTVPAE